MKANSLDQVILSERTDSFRNPTQYRLIISNADRSIPASRAIESYMLGVGLLIGWICARVWVFGRRGSEGQMVAHHYIFHTLSYAVMLDV